MVGVNYDWGWVAMTRRTPGPCTGSRRQAVAGAQDPRPGAGAEVAGDPAAAPGPSGGGQVLDAAELAANEPAATCSVLQRLGSSGFSVYVGWPVPAQRKTIHSPELPARLEGATYRRARRVELPGIGQLVVMARSARQYILVPGAGPRCGERVPGEMGAASGRGPEGADRGSNGANRGTTSCSR